MKYAREPLTRGTKLNPTNNLLVATTIAADVVSVAVDANQENLDLSPFRLSVHWPAVSSALYAQAESASGPLSALCMPFNVIEPQDTFSATGIVPSLTRVILDEVSFSFDQRAEGVAIGGVGAEGTLLPNEVDRLQIRVAIVAKTCSAFDLNAGLDPEREVWSGTIDPIALAGEGFRFNPGVWSDIRTQMDPSQTFALIVECVGMYDAVTPIMLPSVTVSMRFLRNMRSRMTNAVPDTVQNLPTLQSNTPVSDFDFGISVPIPTGTALADGLNGFNTLLSAFDQRLQGQLLGGNNRDGYLPKYEHLINTEGYYVICVPMWTNVGPKGYVLANDCLNLPYANAAGPNALVTDQRVIPLEEPLVIHHVLLGLNSCAPLGLTSGRVASGATLNHTVGVALYSGPGGDSAEFAQVAYTNFTPATKALTQFDRWRYKWSQLMTLDPAFNNPNFDMLVCPLVGAGGVSFNDMFTGAAIAQGKPVYAGRNPWGLRTRSNLNGVAAATAGAEQSLVVRWSINDINGLGGPALGGGQPFDNDVLVGFGGHYVYLLCTTGSTSTRFDRSE